MSPLLINIVLFGAVVVAGTILGALAFVGVGFLLRTRIDSWRAHGTAFIGSLTATMFYTMLLRFMDNPEEDLHNAAFFIAAAVGLAVSFVAIMKAFEIDPAWIPVMWLPFGVILGTCFFLSRTLGEEWRENSGFYRGYESVANLNMLNPPNAMSTPEKAVQYYNNEYKKLTTANEDEGIGKILTTPTHWDAKWFNDNYPFIVKAMSKRDPFGLTKILQDPKQHRVLALSRLARPIYGRVQDVHTEGNEALVLMDSGQLVRLHKEGRNWKVRDWLGMRPLVQQEIHEIKDQSKALQPADKRDHAEGFEGYEKATRAMAERAGFPYTPFVMIQAPKQNDEARAAETGQAPGARREPSKPVSRTGYPRLDAAPPGALIDLTNDVKETEAPRAAATPTPVSADAVVPAFLQTLAKLDRNDLAAIGEFLNQVSYDDRQWFQNNATHIAEIATPGQKYAPEQVQMVALRALAQTMPRQFTAPPKVITKDVHGVATLADTNGKPHVTLLNQENGRWILVHPFFVRTYTWMPYLAQYKKGKNLPLAADEQAALAQGLVPMQQQVQKIYDYVGFKP